VVIFLKGKSRSIISVIVMLYLLVSCICFDDFKTGDLMRPSDVKNESTQILMYGNNSIKEDMCTVEMLGTAQAILLCRQTAIRNSETQRKSESQFGGYIAIAALQVPFKSFISVNTLFFEDNGDLTETIHFIHNKDGKKKI
jgi:hypothetical protein